MNEGRIEQIDTPEAIYNTPRTNFVAGFVGTNNIFRGHVLATAGDFTEVHCAHGPVTVLTRGNAPKVGEHVTVVVQADKLHRRPAGTANENSVTAQLRGREYAGSQNIYLLDLVDGTEVKLIAQESPGEAAGMALNQPVTVHFSAENASIIGYAETARAARVAAHA
jgi:ABC-type Fe3+/spermidine/putrescine transport system ATPase subunit